MLEGKRIGAIRRLVIEKVSGRVVYADMTFGGLLGIGAHLGLPPWCGGGRSEYHAAARVMIASMLARASAGVR